MRFFSKLICKVRILAFTLFLLYVTFICINLNSSNNSIMMAGAAAAAATVVKNSSCNSIPSIGFGTFLLPREKVRNVIFSALNNGYRRIDCAPVYFNEDKVGDALREYMELKENKVSRNDLYIVSKLASPFHRKEYVESAVRKTLQDLGLDYLDLYLIHWPVAFHPVPIPTTKGWETEEIDDSGNGDNIDLNVSIHETWQGMEDLVHKGLVKAIGVSNFPVMTLHELMTQAKIPPLVNQVELHPYLQQHSLIRYCQKRGVQVQAYSPLGTPGYVKDELGEEEPLVLQDPILQSIADKYYISMGQLCIKWAIQRGITIVVKSESDQHQKENIAMANNNDDLSSIQLTEEEMKQIQKLDRNYRFFRPEEWWENIPVAVFN